MQRNWTTVAGEYVQRIGKDDIEKTIDELDWQDVPEGGKLTLPFIPGEAINTAIAEFDIPKVSKVALGSFELPAPDAEGDGFYPGFYGIEGNYKNGRARVFVLDTGTVLVPIVSDFYPVPA